MCCVYYTIVACVERERERERERESARVWRRKEEEKSGKVLGHGCIKQRVGKGRKPR